MTVFILHPSMTRKPEGDGTSRTIRRRVVSATLLLLLTAIVIAIPESALGVPTAPEPSYSLYVTTATNAQLCNWGQNLAQGQNASPATVAADAFIFMHFFAPKDFGGGSYGATRSNGPDQTTSELRTAAQRLGECWFAATGAGKTLKIAMGVSSDSSTAVTTAHGAAWATMVKAANTWAANNGYNGRLSFNGAFDPEPGFAASINKVKNWIDGYRGVTGAWNSFHYGGAAGCPSDVNPNTTCTWPADDIIYVAWATGITTAFPQIYLEPPAGQDPPTSIQAQQWQRLSARSVNNGTDRINFAGGLSQYQACVDTGGCASNAKLRPKASWRDLWDEINCTYGGGNPCPTSDDLRWTTQLTWKQTL